MIRKNPLICLMASVFLLTGCSSGEKELSQKELSAEDLYHQGGAALKAQDTQTAIKLFEQAVTLNPDIVSAYQILAQLYVRTKNYPDAIKILTTAMNTHPNYGEFPYLLAICYARIGQLEKAYDAAKRSAEVHEAWQRLNEMNKAKALMNQIEAAIQKSQTQ